MTVWFDTAITCSKQPKAAKVNVHKMLYEIQGGYMIARFSLYVQWVAHIQMHCIKNETFH